VVFNLLSTCAGYGVMTVASEGGLLGAAIEVEHKVPVPAIVPTMLAPLLFGLSITTELLLVSRVQEGQLRFGELPRPVAYDLRRTAAPILALTAIGTVLLFPLILSSDMSLKFFGLGLSTAVLVDGILVKMALLPAVMRLLGARNWWLPAWLGRVLPHVGLQPRNGVSDGTQPAAR
jgi:RND superfamily putative drug exporter